MKLFLSAFLLSFILITAPAMVQAQGNVPSMPDALKLLEERGAQSRYLGKKHGLDGWITIFQGQEQYYYVTPDGNGFVMGLLFDKEGEMVTLQQVRDLQKQSDGDVLDFLAADKERPDLTAAVQETNEVFDYKSPAERMFADIENSNWIPFGEGSAPVIYSFMDPQCPHCHSFMQDLKEDYLDKGLIQVRMVPVGFREETLAQAAFLLAAPDAPKRFFDHLDGDEKALPIKNSTSTQGIQKNLALMQTWKFNVTPMTVYRGKDGKVKIIRGRAGNLADILTDLPPS